MTHSVPIPVWAIVVVAAFAIEPMIGLVLLCLAIISIAAALGLVVVGALEAGRWMRERALDLRRRAISMFPVSYFPRRRR